MLKPRRAVPLFAVAVFGFVFLIGLLQSATERKPWRDLPQMVGLGEVVQDEMGASGAQSPSPASGQASQTGKGPAFKSHPSFSPGTPPGPGHNYTKVVVMPKVRDEKTDWLQQEIPDVQAAIYVADDPSAPLHPPKNKGNEVMIYLTYLIDHYEDLPEIMLFMHSHRYSWHNNDIFGHDACEMITRLSSERVVREGYMNLRCHWNPGCPDWMHPGRMEEDDEKREERELAQVWTELFPLEPIPPVLAQPCCSQFALSRERAHAILKTDYVFYRDWLMRTHLNNYLSGRVWEYLWHYLFRRESSFCPDQHVCYCDGYGVCFEDEKAFDHWFKLKRKQHKLQKELNGWRSKAKLIEDAAAKGFDESDQLEVPETGKDVALEQEIEHIRRRLDDQREVAMQRGNDPRKRAEIAGRQWHKGDWY